ncbi:MAG: alpha/beta hydrolase [Pseudomonadales bacterium]|nr:alpha/beta hydrolase [Pseudomonadales bacterium]
MQDTRCAVWWVIRNAEKYGFDTERLVLTGRFAGGHLSLITGMLSGTAGLDNRCPESKGGNGTDRALASTPDLNVAAIVNWAGITDVNDLISGPNAVGYAITWLGGQPNSEANARQVSPLTWVREDLPPILTLHGNRDQVVPYDHAVRLHEALDEANVPNQLHTIQGREHFVDFTAEDMKTAHKVIDAFLLKHLN